MLRSHLTGVWAADLTRTEWPRGAGSFGRPGAAVRASATLPPLRGEGVAGNAVFPGKSGNAVRLRFSLSMTKFGKK